MNETAGRKVLWTSALAEVDLLLSLAERSERNAGAEKRKAPSAGEFEAADEFNHIDYVHVADTARMMATILFCQQFKSGHGVPGIAASNTKFFRDTILENALLFAFPTPEERTKFDAVRAQLERARDKAIGHADAAEFDIRFAQQHVSLRGFSASIRGIDFTYVRSVLSDMIAGIRQGTDVL